MTLDRRELVTGLATTAAAANMPAFAVGAGLRARRIYFPEGLLFSLAVPWSHASYAAHWNARWHFDPNPKGHALVKHEGSGLAFRYAPQPDDPFVMEAVFIDAPLGGMPDAAAIAAVGLAAIDTFVHARSLCCWQRRKGAIYVRNREWKSDAEYTGPHVEDAPPLV